MWHGRCRRLARRSPRAGRLPVALVARSAVVAVDPGRGAADRRGDPARPRLRRPAGRRDDAARGRRRRDRARTGALPRRRRPRHAGPGRHPPRRRVPDAGGPGREDDGLRRRPHLGQLARRRDDHDVRHLPARGRGPRAPAARVAADARARPGGDRLPARAAAGRRDRQGRPGPGGRARPPARPAADRHPARLVLAPRSRGPGLVPRPRRPDRRPRPAHAPQRPGGAVDGGERWRAPPASRAPRSPAASTTSSASRR